ncbi:MAG: hypothetical protein IR153_06275 [Flavobacterium sp.]|nr:hypothetical protein [Flavobacterium sp.]
MKLATGNIERLKHHRKIAEIIAACEDADADILVLTEYDDRVDLKSYPYHFI